MSVIFFDVFSLFPQFVFYKNLKLIKPYFNDLPWDYSHFLEIKNNFLYDLLIKKQFCFSSISDLNIIPCDVYLSELSVEEYNAYLNINPTQRKFEIDFLAYPTSNQSWFISVKDHGSYINSLVDILFWFVEEFLNICFSRFTEKIKCVSVKVVLLKNIITNNSLDVKNNLDECDYFCEWSLERFNVSGGCSVIKVIDSNKLYFDSVLQPGQGVGFSYRKFSSCYTKTPLNKIKKDASSYISNIRFLCNIGWK